MREKILLLVAFLFLVPAFAEVEELPSGDYVGLSSDTKPTSGVSVADLFTEIDSQRRFVWSGSAWIPLEPHPVTVTAKPTLDTDAYQDNDVLGGVVEFDGAARVNNGGGIVQTWTFADVDGQNANLVAYVFEKNPASGTYTDDAALTLNAADVELLVDQFAIAASDWKDEGGISTYSINRTKPFRCSGDSDSIYLLLMVDTSTPTYTASGLVITAGVLPQ